MSPTGCGQGVLLLLLAAATALLARCGAQPVPPFYADQKQNCSIISASSYCYNGPHLLGTQHKSCKVPGTLALTFDDGPHPVHTPIILDVLAQYGWKATFFLIGREVAKYPEVVQRILDEGHQIGSHTQNHTVLSGVPASTVYAEMLTWEATFLATGLSDANGGVMPAYMRPRGGALDATSAPILTELGYTAIHWGYLTMDMQGATAEQTVDIHAAHFGPTTRPDLLTLIVQAHDIRIATVDSFPDVAAYLDSLLGQQGTSFVTIAECMGAGAPAPFRVLPRPPPPPPPPAPPRPPAPPGPRVRTPGAQKPYYVDRKQNCSLTTVSGSLCYGGPRMRGIQYRSCKVPGTVALTFDDGPHPVHTPVILDVLAQYGWKATFFMIGREMAKYPDVVQRILDDGHQIGSHTQNHVPLLRLSADAIEAELADFESTFMSLGLAGSAAGLVPSYVRPPGGGLDETGEAVLTERGNTAINWGYLTLEWQGALPSQFVDIHESHLGPGTVAEELTLIVQHHDSLAKTADAFADGNLASYLDGTLAGARFVSVADCLDGPPAYKVPQ